MPECAYCKAETQLFVGEVPVCVKCIERRDAKRKRPTSDPEVGDFLHEEVLDAQDRARIVLADFEAVTSEIPSGLPQPDGAQRIHSVSRRMKIAHDEVMTAHKRLNDFVERRIVPEDLKRSG